VLDGVAGTYQLVLNPPDSLNEGDTVAIAPAAAAKEEGKGNGAKKGAAK
jgi:hypothetical protein